MNRIKSVIFTVRENKDVIISNAIRIGIPVAGVAVTFVLIQKALNGALDILEARDTEFEIPETNTAS